MTLSDMRTELSKMVPGNNTAIDAAAEKIQVGICARVDDLDTLGKINLLSSDLDTFLKDIQAHLISHSGDAYLTKKLDDLSHYIRTIPQKLNFKTVENSRACYTNAGEWAIHYSTVRMVVSTFLITTSWGVVGLNWKEPSGLVLIAAAGIWALSLCFFFAFTQLTYKRSLRQDEFRKLLLTPIDEPNKNPHETPAAKLKRKINEDLARQFYLIATVLYLAFLGFWYCKMSSEVSHTKVIIGTVRPATCGKPEVFEPWNGKFNSSPQNGDVCQTVTSNITTLVARQADEMLAIQDLGKQVEYLVTNRSPSSVETVFTNQKWEHLVKAVKRIQKSLNGQKSRSANTEANQDKLIKDVEEIKGLVAKLREEIAAKTTPPTGAKSEPSIHESGLLFHIGSRDVK